MMVRTFFASLLTLASLTTFANEYVCDFTNGKFPAKVATENVNSLYPVSDCYQHGYTRFGWYVYRFGTENVAMSPTHTGSERECENRITLPPFTVEKDAIIRWTARSVLDILRESYYIEALVEDDPTPVRIATVSNENNRWTTHIESLNQFIGKTITVRLVCNSRNRYMMLLRNIYLGNPENILLETLDNTAPYTDMENSKVSVKVLNTGRTLTAGEIVCIADGNEIAAVPVTTVWRPGEERDFEFATPAVLNARTEYEVIYRTGDETISLAKGDYFSSHFVRRHLVDKGTGTWCSNCPAGMLALDGLREQLGESLVAVETHVGSDPMTNQEYWDNLGFYAAPYFKLNRIDKTAQSDLSLFGPYLDQPVEMAVEVTDMEADEEKATLTLNVRTLPDFDNADDRFRIGYVVTKSYYDPTDRRFEQHNNLTLATAERFYLLPSTIPSQFMTYHNVSVSYEEAFGGIAGSIPPTVPAEGAEYTLEVPCPQKAGTFDGCNIALFILDSVTGHVMNAAKKEIMPWTAGVKRVENESDHVRLNYLGGGRMKVEGVNDYSLDVYNLSGQLCMRTDSSLFDSDVIDIQLPSGIYIVHLRSTEGSKSIKIILSH